MPYATRPTKRAHGMANVPERRQIFLSYSSDDSCEASLLVYVIESLLARAHVDVWTYQRDQARDTRSIATSLKDQVGRSQAMVFLASPSTLKIGAAQWMELAYADAALVPTYVLLHRISYSKLRMKERGAPPFITEGHCTPSVDWRRVVDELGSRLTGNSRGAGHGA
jgi:hypothetical protein